MDAARTAEIVPSEALFGSARAEKSSALALAERSLAEARGDLVEFVRLFTVRTNPGGIYEEVAESTALWGVQARRWLWKNFPPYKSLCRRASGGFFNGNGERSPTLVYPLPPMQYPGFDAKGAARIRSNVTRRRQDKRRGVVRCQAVVAVDTKTGRSAVQIVSQSLDYLRKKAPELVTLTIDGQPWHQCRVEDALRWAEKRGAETQFISIIAGLCADPRRSIGEQMTPEMIDQALTAAGLG